MRCKACNKKHDPMWNSPLFDEHVKFIEPLCNKCRTIALSSIVTMDWEEEDVSGITIEDSEVRD